MSRICDEIIKIVDHILKMTDKSQNGRQRGIMKLEND
jgi:hypothetical protein